MGNNAKILQTRNKRNDMQFSRKVLQKDAKKNVVKTGFKGSSIRKKGVIADFKGRHDEKGV